MPLGVLGTEEITTIGLQFFAWFLKVTEESRKKKTVHSEKLVFNLLCITLYKASRLKSLFGDYDMEGTEVADVAPFRLCNQFLSRYVSMIYYSNDKIEN